jgi:mannose-1-phosphate guanylyltransferase/mannose-1-phosphate guanylyltransferase/phosphomannomutase
MILAGGLSTRLYPLTKQVPKPLVPVAGVPNAIHLVRYLKSYGYDEIAINVFYLADAIIAKLGDGSAFGVRIEYLHESVLMGSAGALKPMQSFFGSEPFVVVGCDDLTDLRLDRLTAFHQKKGAIATIGLVERDEVDQYGVVVVDDNGKIVGFQEKPAPGTERSKLVNTGIYAFSPGIFDHIPPNEFYDFGKQVFPALQEAGAAFYGYDARDAYWCDIGTPGEYRRATADVVSGKFRVPGGRSTGADPTAKIGQDVRIDGNAWIGAGASIGNGTRIVGPSVIGDGVHIGADAAVVRSIVWESAIIGSQAKITDTIVGMNYAVAPGAMLTGATVANDS